MHLTNDECFWKYVHQEHCSGKCKLYRKNKQDIIQYTLVHTIVLFSHKKKESHIGV